MENAVVLFDGACNLCQYSVQFIIRRDSAAFFRFASLQSAVAQEMLRPFGPLPAIPQSVIVIHKGRIYSRSTAALHIARRLDGWWPLFFAAIIIPPAIRDALYNLVARYRYRLFGRSDACWLPSPALQSRFL
jgi:predicted DCC family thiol-disulfide oxidoreductase YuxK